MLVSEGWSVASDDKLDPGAFLICKTKSAGSLEFCPKMVRSVATDCQSPAKNGLILAALLQTVS